MTTKTNTPKAGKTNTPKAGKTNTPKAGNGAIVVEGLSEALAEKAALVARVAELQTTQKNTDRIERDRAIRAAKLEQLIASERNTQIRPHTLRPGNDGELINGKPHKGWVVEIECAECGAIRLINTQDAFQVKFCNDHVGNARKAAGKARRALAKTAKLEALSEDELRAQIAKLEAAAA